MYANRSIQPFQYQVKVNAVTCSQTSFEISKISEANFTDISFRRSQAIEIIWFRAGTCQVSVDSENYHIYGAAILCLRPGEVYRLSGAENLEGFVIRFSAEFLYSSSGLFSKNLFNFTQSRLVRLDTVAEILLLEIVHNMYRELQFNYAHQQEVLRGLLRIFSIYVGRQEKVVVIDPVKSTSSILAKRFFTVLEQHYKTLKRVSDYADLLAVTSNHLNETVKKESGYSASSQIRKRLVLEAKRKIISDNESLKSIAYDLGFADCAHFSKYFKLECGLTFTDYRKMIVV